MTKNPELPKRRIVARIDVQADSWGYLQWALDKALEQIADCPEERFLATGNGAGGFGFRIDVNINESQTAESYQRALAEWLRQGEEVKP